MATGNRSSRRTAHEGPVATREQATEPFRCEYDDEWSFTKAFETPEQIWEYAEALLPPRRGREARPAGGLPILAGTGPIGIVGG